MNPEQINQRLAESMGWKLIATIWYDNEGKFTGYYSRHSDLDKDCVIWTWKGDTVIKTAKDTNWSRSSGVYGLGRVKLTLGIRRGFMGQLWRMPSNLLPGSASQ